MNHDILDILARPISLVMLQSMLLLYFDMIILDIPVVKTHSLT